jgi:hypothetical protein
VSIFLSGTQGFYITQYGQSGVVMDWFQLPDPFTQTLPLKITNTFTQPMWFQGTLVNPRSGYYNGSGVQMGVVSGGLSSVLLMSWSAGVSGWISTSSPVTDILTLELVAFLSGTAPYTTPYTSGSVVFPNTLFNRYSGVIKVFGDPYNNDQPQPSCSLVAGGSLVSGSAYQYAISYNLSGWESDIGAYSGIQVTSGYGSVALSWSSITGVSQYFVWRWSGLFNDNGAPLGLMAPMDLIKVATTNSFTDIGGAIVEGGLFRMRTWMGGPFNNSVATTDTVHYLSPPESRDIYVPGSLYTPTTPQTWAHAYHLGTNLSGTSLLGPFYVVFHTDALPTEGGNPSINPAWAINTANNVFMSGLVVADNPTLFAQAGGVWYRNALILGSSGTLSSSGYSTLQIQSTTTGVQAQITMAVDDVYIVALS